MKIRVLVFTLLISFSAAAYSNTDVEQIQAMYIYNFIKHIQWPENSVKSEFVIGVYGNSNIYQHLLNYTKGKSLGQKKIRIVQISSLDQAVNCQLLVVTQQKSSQMNSIVNHPNLKNTLIVGDKPGTIAEGGAIEFALVDNKMKFRISEDNANKHNIRISKSLLDMSI